MISDAHDRDNGSDNDNDAWAFVHGVPPRHEQLVVASGSHHLTHGVGFVKD